MATDIFKIKPLGNQAAAGKTSAGSRTTWSRRDLLHALVVVGNVTAFILVQLEVPDPYLDEIFHIPQTQRYCDEDFDSWDPSITTPPGLYILSAVPLMTVHIPCTTPLLRLTNLLFTTITIPFILSCIISSCLSSNAYLTSRASISISSPDETPPSEPLTGQSYPNQGSRQSSGTTRWYHHLLTPCTSALVCSSFPLISFFGNLYYTDVASLAGVLGCWALALRGYHWSASFIGILSLTVRQTNIVWVAFILATSLLRLSVGIQADLGKKLDEVERTLADPPLSDVRSLGDILDAVRSTVAVLLSNPKPTLAVIIPYIPTFLGFLAFLKWNGGIVLGHKEQHQPVIHFPQMLYFIAFASLMFWPVLFSEGMVRTIKGGLGVGLGTWRRVAGSLFAIGVMAVMVRHFTVIHPFLLADNRHYVFYVFNRILIPYPMSRYILIPGYLVCSWLWIWRLSMTTNTSFLWLRGFLICTALVTVPTPLVEPRYFLIPLIILRTQPEGFRTLSVQRASSGVDKNGRAAVTTGLEIATARRDVWIEYGWYSLINLATLSLFLGYRFRWEGWDGWMRFMW